MPQQQRVWILSVVTLVIIGGLVVRLADLQIVRASYFKAVAENQRKRAAELAPHRGIIYLQEHGSGEVFPVAVNDKAWVAYAVPRDMEEPLKIAQELAPALQEFRGRQQERINDILVATGQQPREEGEETANPEAELAALTEELYHKFNQRTDPYEPFLRFYETADEQLRDFLAGKNLPGVVLEEVDARAYPEKTLAAHVLGYLGWQDDRQVGRYGIEGHFEGQLAGNLGFFSAEHDSSGSVIGVAASDFTPAQDGADIVLTIDRVVQSIIEEELASGVERYGATRGSIIVSDPMTGAVLGMATYPTYDPNYYYAINEARVQLNPTVSELFEPGSILKPIIMAIALAEDVIKPDTTFVDTGPVRVAEYTINTFDGRHHGVQTMTQVLEQSNNVGMVWVGQQLGAETMYDYLRRFGLGEKTGIELEGEIQSTLKEPDEWNVATIATTAFGQGIALTPLQALNAINTLANGGVLVQPHIVSRVRYTSGEEEIMQPTTIRRVIPESVASQASAMMVSVIEKGVGQLARVPGYYLAGKTGTAQVPDEHGSYDPDRKIISFVGFGPASQPRFSIIIKLDDPAGLSFASGTAAPMFRNISEKLLNYYQVLPDYETGDDRPPVVPSQPSSRGALAPPNALSCAAGQLG
jgi:cell division protein FtsI/penicillin-binding protein 2